MDFRLVVLCLAFWLTPALADVQNQLDNINRLVYQYPSQALNEINALEAITSPLGLTEIDKLRLSLLRCETFLQLGENQAAINIARMNEAKAKVLELEQARPYFLNCMAGAFNNYGDFRQALPLLDTSIMLSRELKQPQSLVNGLRLRGIIDTQIDSYSNAFEDLGLASDIYSDTQSQAQNWALPPHISIELALSQFLAKSGKHRQAYDVITTALTTEVLKGKSLLTAKIQQAKLSQVADLPASARLIKQAKKLLPELETAFELAESYTQIAQIEHNRGNDSRAIQLLEISLDTFIKHKSTLERLRAQRLLAEILFQTGDEPKATSMINQAIETGQRTAKFYELVRCFEVLSHYYAKQGDFELGYQYQQQKFTAAENAYQFIKDTRLQQLNTRLSRQQVSHNISINQGLIQESHIPFKSQYILLILFFFTLFITYKYRNKSHQVSQPPATTLSPEQNIERLISHSKVVGYPLTLLLIDPVHIFHGDLSALQTRLASLLREQDIVTSDIEEDIAILLPYTQEAGALKIIEQIKEVMMPLLHGNTPSIGYAKLQQQDSLSSLIKRAKVKQLLLKNKKL